MKFFKLYFLFLAILFFTLNGYSQEVSLDISGTILDSVSHRPLDHASVYLSNTTLGTYTSENGSFELTGIAPGTYDLVISYVGYERHVVSINESSYNHDLVILLHHSITQLKDVVVRAGIQNKDYLRIFERYFIGIDENAADCKILNTEVLFFNMDSTTGIFTAEATAPLIIRNLALGYIIYYDLQSFRWDNNSKRLTYFGYPKFEEIGKAGKRRMKKWNNNRITTYLGSMRHFMKSLVSHQLEEQGFKVNKIITIHDSYLDKDYSVLTSDTVRYDSMVTIATERPGYMKLQFSNTLYILPFHYKTPELNRFFGWKKDAPLSEMKVTKTTSSFLSTTHQAFTPCQLTMTVTETFIDPNGALTDPLAVIKNGGWADRQVADLLPLDYKMPELE